MQKNSWLIDVSLIIIIIVMGAFVVVELNRTFDFLRRTPERSMSSEESSSFDSFEPTPQPDFVVETKYDAPAPNFELVNLTGEYVSLSDFLGTPVLINFWATWCPPCRNEMPLIESFAKKHDHELIVLAINAGEEEQVVRAFVDETGLDLIFLLDPTNTVANLYRVVGFPTSLFIDENGILQATFIGELDEDLMLSYLEIIGVYQ